MEENLGQTMLKIPETKENTTLMSASNSEDEGLDISSSFEIYEKKSRRGEPRTKINVSSLIGKKDKASTKDQNEYDEAADEAASSSISPLCLSSDTLSPPTSPFLQSDSDSGGETCSLDAIRKENQEKMTAFINSLRNPELENKLSGIKRNVLGNAEHAKNQKQPKKRNYKDSAIRFRVEPLEPRKSARLQNKTPCFKEGDLENVHENVRHIYFKRPNYNIDDYLTEDIEEVVYRPKRKSTRRSSGFQKKEQTRVIIPVGEVTEEMLNNIALRVKTKIYSENGTTCHQCRQKTLDQKTCCRNVNCVGIQGMFCGVCIKNRYGEDCAEALLNSNWTCPVCREKCNCSICRNRQGKRPTGILTPIALQHGFLSVDHFLSDLRGEGDKPEEDDKYALQRDLEALLGFSENGRKAHLNHGRVELMQCEFCKLDESENPENLLGFSDDENFAIMGGHKLEKLFKL